MIPSVFRTQRAVLALICTLGLISPVLGARSPLVRIGLMDQESSVTLGPGDFRLLGESPRQTKRYKTQTKIQLSSKGFIIGKKSWGPKIFVSPTERSGTVVINKRVYRGQIELTRKGAGIRVVNILSVEDYVRGVLQMETSDKWPEQSLKAQAVISRTYGLRNRGRHGRSGYDLCSKPHCQVYGGVAAERKKTDTAVEQTRGEVLVDRKRHLVSTVFHSSCGGSTESAENVWEHGGAPHLKAARCSWCKSNPYAHWVARVPYDLVWSRLKAAGVDVGHIRAIGVLSHTPSGRVYKLRLYGDQGKMDLLANKFRTVVDPRLIRSTLWTGISKRNGAWQIHGRGWGHGVGVCQWGMKGQADKGRSYGDILRTYYHHVKVVDWNE
ncbi:MAG: SpoIID/LytB domain-containing protein [Elusimicrobia bacterium]|jgi:stage II sporulation protein D|nr:SpoIID/LytB domain-containing protein [Elusimicrobiota bacterium]